MEDKLYQQNEGVDVLTSKKPRASVSNLNLRRWARQLVPSMSIKLTLWRCDLPHGWKRNQEKLWFKRPFIRVLWIFRGSPGCVTRSQIVCHQVYGVISSSWRRLKGCMKCCWQSYFPLKNGGSTHDPPFWLPQIGSATHPRPAGWRPVGRRNKKGGSRANLLKIGLDAGTAVGAHCVVKCEVLHPQHLSESFPPAHLIIPKIHGWWAVVSFFEISECY